MTNPFSSIGDLIHEAYHPTPHSMTDRLSRGVVQNELFERSRRLAYEIEGRLAKCTTNGVSSMAADIMDMCRAADHIGRELAGEVKRTAPVRMGVPGQVWACEYTSGWSLYVRGRGLVSEGLTEQRAAVCIDVLLPLCDTNLAPL